MAAAHINILDARLFDRNGDAATQQIVSHQILEGLRRPSSQKSLPTLLLYDERGLRLYDDITTEAPEYYLFGTEEDILKNHAHDIVSTMHAASGGVIQEEEVILELGAGALRKTSHILLALSGLVSDSLNTPPVTYYALDLEERELQRCLGDLTKSNIGAQLQGKVAMNGLRGTYEEGLKLAAQGKLHNISTVNRTRGAYVLDRGSRDSSPSSDRSYQSSSGDIASDITTPSTPDNSQPPLHMLFLGSSLGNFNREESIEFLRSLPLRPGSGDTLLLGLDHDNDPRKIEVAYNDPKGHTKAFIMNGLKAAGRALGDETLFNEDKWEYVNQYNEAKRRHEAYYKSKVAHTVTVPSTEEKVSFLADELVNIEVSYKYSEVDAYSLFVNANLRPVQRWTDSESQYSLWVLERPAFVFPLLSSPASIDVHKPTKSPFSVPSVKDWQNLWAAWDLITLRMIPPSMLFQKPIDLRHICLFYLGHIPTFLDIHLTRLLEGSHTEPVYFKDIFERGIDPNVDDPTQCHSHSIVPEKDEDWPTLESILDFESRVRQRLLKIYEDAESGKKAMTRKVARVLFMTYEHEALHAETLLYMLLQRAGTGTLPPPGFTPPPWSSLSAQWDALPALASASVVLGPEDVVLGHDDIEAEDSHPDKALDVDSHEFGWDNESPKRVVHVNKFKIDFSPITNGEFFEYMKRAGKGQVEMPASWVEHDGEHQVRTVYGPVPMKIAWKWPLMTSYDNLSKFASVKGGRIPTEPELRLFFNKFMCGYEGGANVGFRNWHPTPATMGGAKDEGKGHNGGVWEWTSTPFERYEGFEASALYPGYSTDFFDDAHHAVIGGSYATIPRISERKSFRNWYQKNYAYPWVGGRVAYDVQE